MTSFKWYLVILGHLLDQVREEETYFDLLYSNSMCRQSSIPTSILIALLLSGGIRYECTQISFSFVTSAIRRETVTRIKYLLACQQACNTQDHPKLTVVSR